MKFKSLFSSDKQEQYRFVWPKNFQNYDVSTVNWNEAYSVMWFIFDENQKAFISDQSIIIHPHLFLVLIRDQIKHLILLKDVLLVVNKPLITIKMCKQIQEYAMTKNSFNYNQIREISYCKYRLKQIDKNFLSGLLVEEILERGKLVDQLRIRQFFVNHKFEMKPIIPEQYHKQPFFNLKKTGNKDK